MGGDHGVRVTLPSIADFLRAFDDCSVLLVGNEKLIRPFLTDHPAIGSRCSILHTEEEVLSSDPISVALRQKKSSSMRLAIEQVRDGVAQAAVSAGNTGALMALSRFLLKTHPGIDRPAIISALPTSSGHCYMLDLGANVDVEADHLLQFARMGALVAQLRDNRTRPRVALLNIGSEDIKGNQLIKSAHQLLMSSDLHYVGYIEGDGIFRDEADVVVCDGFVGNVALKCSEGVAHLLADRIRFEVSRSPLRKFLGLLSLPIWRALKKQMDPSLYNGASLVGLTGVVVKSHGGASRQGFLNALGVARAEAIHNLPDRIAGCFQPTES